MKLVITFLISIISVVSFASHAIGGAVSWKNVGPGQFVFRAELLTRCYCASCDPFGNKTLDGPQGSITMKPIDMQGFSSSCYDPGLHCMNTGAIGPVSQIVYESDTITLTGTPPASGWVFSFKSALCCGSQASNMLVPSNKGIDVYSIMFPETMTLGLSSPQFVENYEQSITTFNHIVTNQAFTSYPVDSLYYKRVHPSLGNSMVGFNSGFDYLNPFPDNSDSPSNGPISFNPFTGSFTVDVQSGPAGYYGYTVAVEQWHIIKSSQTRTPVKVSEIRKDYQVPLNVTTSNNSAPLASIDTSQFSVVKQLTPTDYVAVSNVGDTLRFNIVGLDGDLDSNFLPQNITFDAKGAALDSSWGGWELYSSVPKLVPLQQGFTNPSSNVVEFKWVISSDLVDSADSYHTFSFSFTDDNCNYMGRGVVNVLVKVNGPKDTTSAGVGVQEWDLSNPKVFPNPVGESFTISDLSGKSRVQILDVQGKVINTYNVTNRELEVPRNNLPAGIYFIKVYNQNNTSTMKLIFE